MSSAAHAPRASSRLGSLAGWLRRHRIDPYALSGLVVLFVMLLPARMSSFQGDDSFTSEWAGQGALAHESIWHQMSFGWQANLDSGRPSLLGTFMGYLTSWELGNHRAALKLWIVVCIAAAAYLLYRLAIELGAPAWVGLLLIVSMAGAVQFRLYHDGALSYWGVAPQVMITALGSLVLFLRWLRAGRRRQLVGAIALFVACLLLYDVPYPFGVLFLALALFERRGSVAVKAAAPFLAISALFMAYGYFGRLSAPPEASNPVYGFGGSAWGALRVFFVQLFTPIPGSSLILGNEYANFFPLGTDPTRAELAGAAWRGLAVAGIVMAVSALVVRGRLTLPAPRLLWRLSVIGALIWILPVTLISLASKYQDEIKPGKGHLPALMQDYGWALVAVAIALTLLRVGLQRSRVAGWLTAVALALLIGAGAAVDGYINLRVVALEQPIVATRDLLESSLANGVLNTLPADSTVLFNGRDVKWFTGNLSQNGVAFEAMLRDRTGRPYDARMIEPPVPLPPACADIPDQFPPPDCAPPRHASAWLLVRAKPGGGTVVLAPVGRQDSLAATTTAGVRNLVAYTEDDRPPVLQAQTVQHQPWTSQFVHWRELKHGDGWTIYAGQTPPGERLLGETINEQGNTLDFYNLGQPGELVRRFGTARVLP